MADADTLPEALPLEPPDNGATLASVVLVPGDADEQLELELLRRGQRGALEGHEEEEAALQPNGDRRDNAAVSDPRQEIGHPAHLQYLDLGDECEARENGDDHHHRLPEEQEEDHAILLGRDITQDFVAEADSARVIMLDVAPTLKRITLVVMPVFMAYAVLLSLQERLRRFLGITDSNSDAAHVFQFGVSLIFMGDLIFRLSHNVLLSFLRPRSRVYFAYFCVCVSMCIVVGAYYAAGSKSLTWVYIAYFVGGMGIGTFETNIVSCITPLGHKTKEAAIIGMPLGYNGVSIGAFAVFALCPSSVAIEAGTFLFVWVANMIGAFIFYTVPDIHFEASEDTAKKFILDIVRHWRQWLPLTWTYLACMFVNMFGVILMSGVVLYIFDSDTVKLLPVATAPSMSKDAFQMVYNVCAFLGDFTSRKVAYRFQRRVHPCWFLVLLAVGIALGLCRVALLAWPGMFLVMFANGALYATTTKFVDASVPHQFNLVVFSIWLFIGDCGSYVASSLTDYIAAAVG